jgi:hypothetical protein
MGITASRQFSTGSEDWMRGWYVRETLGTSEWALEGSKGSVPLVHMYFVVILDATITA